MRLIYRHLQHSGLLAAVAAAALGSVTVASAPLRAAELQASDGAAADAFGDSASLSGNSGLVGAPFDDIGLNADQGSAYLFRSLDTATGTITESVKLTASDGAATDLFGYSASLSGNSGLVGAYLDDIASNADQGSAYLFRNLDTATGTITENAKLTASDGAATDLFGYSASLSGNSGLVGARFDEIGSNSQQGSAYLFRNLDTATGTITENAKLTASDGAATDQFGYSASLSGTSGLVGAVGSNSSQGSAYLFRGLDTATGTITENAKLTASDGAAGDNFGSSISLSGNSGLVGAIGDKVGSNAGQGSVYLFRNLDTATGTITENAKLIASDGAANDNFGISVSLSGNTGLVGAYRDDIGSNSDQGSAYLFRNLDTATGTITESVKLIASDGAALENFGRSVALDGDQFVIGAMLGDGATGSSGKAYSGTVSSVTTLDEGNSSGTIDGISFISRTDWIIGETTSNNQVTLTAGDSADVTAAGKAVYIGKNAGSNDNKLVIEGSVTANHIYVGATGNMGNTLQLGGTGNRIGDSVGITLNNGTLDTAGLSETVGMLTSMGTSVIGLGDGSIIFHFADSSSLSASWSGTLSIYDWTGSVLGGGTDQLYFGSDSNGLTMSQLDKISFYSGNGTGFLGLAQILSTGEVVPLSAVPEPATVLGALLLAIALLWRERGRLREILSR
jgi:virulence-associated protein VapD